MIPPLKLRLSDATKTHFAGSCLTETLYDLPVTLFLTGDLGAGKTTFMQGFATALGITDPLTSPTYALEQRYLTKTGIPLLHLDLYRLKERDAAELVESTDGHTGIRCIEWANRLPDMINDTHAIRLHFEEDGDGRLLTIQWHDTALPTEKQIDDWRAELMLPAHITAHCETVARVTGLCADLLIAKGRIVRKEALTAAARLHDLLRFVDFRTGKAAPAGFVNSDAEIKTWDMWRTRYAGQKHETACASFLREHGFPVIATIVSSHGLRSPLSLMESPDTIEQKILFYADKRCMIDTIVTVEERFEDFKVRYTNGQQSDDHDVWYGYTKEIEHELFPDGTPF